jgi:hypothetical protein
MCHQKKLTSELLDRKWGRLIPAVASLRRTVLSEVGRLSMCAGSGGGVGGTLLTLTVLTICLAGDPSPTPTPTPIPF